MKEAYPNIFDNPTQGAWFIRKRKSSGWGECFHRVGGKRLMLNKIKFAEKFQEEAGVIIA